MAVLNARKLRAPLSEKDARGLRLGERVLLSGALFTGRDRLHRHLFDGGTCPVRLAEGALYHCGPVVIRREGAWVVRAAGPTTSLREEPYMARIIEQHGVRAIIGKGGMGPATAAACKRFGCVYLHALGGAAQVLAGTVRSVTGVHLLKEFGAAEALWELAVEDFPVIVAIDAAGRSLLGRVRKASAAALAELFARRFDCPASGDGGGDPE